MPGSAPQPGRPANWDSRRAVVAAVVFVTNHGGTGDRLSSPCRIDRGAGRNGPVTTVRSVSDAQMFAANAAWYQSLPKDLQVAFDAASDKTQVESFAQIAPAREVSMKMMREGGAQFYNPTAAEFRQWVDACGEQRKEWDEFKVRLAGSLDAFDKLRTAANTKGPITVGDYAG